MLKAVTGYKNSGKNEVCNVLRDTYGFTITGFADVLKNMAYDINPLVHVAPGMSPAFWYLQDVVDQFGWEVAKERFPEVRRFLQRLGTEGGRKHLGEDVWINAWASTAEQLLGDGYDVCVSDLRFLNEAQAVRDLGGQVWRVYRPRLDFLGDTHDSETELDSIEIDWKIQNGGSLKDLSDQVKNVMSL